METFSASFKLWPDPLHVPKRWCTFVASFSFASLSRILFSHPFNPHMHTHTHSHTHWAKPTLSAYGQEPMEQCSLIYQYEILRLFLSKNIKFNTFCTYCWFLSYQVNKSNELSIKRWLILNTAPSCFILLKVLFQSETLKRCTASGHTVYDSRGRKKEALLIGWYSWTSLFPAEVYVPDTRW